QAEDGIRDRNVTGVQTCALPILGPGMRTGRGAPRGPAVIAVDSLVPSTSARRRCVRRWYRHLAGNHLTRPKAIHYLGSPPFPCEIGRASCRERASLRLDEVQYKK